MSRPGSHHDHSWKLIHGRLVAFPGSDIMVARPHEVQWVLDKEFHDLMRNRPSS